MFFEVPEWNLGEPSKSKPPKDKMVAQLERPIHSHDAVGKRVKFDPTRNTVHPIPKAPRKGPEWQLIQEMNMRRAIQEAEEEQNSERKRKKKEKRDEKRKKVLIEVNEELEENEMDKKDERKASEKGEKTAGKKGEKEASLKVEKSERKEEKPLDKHAAKLMGARFRFLNERLYTCGSEEALQHFTQNPSDFDHYHRGFREQTARWPVNPLDVFIQRLEKEAPTKAKVADLGCGEARLSRTLRGSRPDLKVHSFDLVAADPELVEKADICNLPLADESVDFVIICLALMNTNYWQAIGEAHRILRPNGHLWIAEVESRFNGGLKGMEQFSQTLQEHWSLRPSSPIDTSHRVFCLLSFVKSSSKKRKRVNAESELPDLLKPCLYKKR